MEDEINWYRGYFLQISCYCQGDSKEDLITSRGWLVLVQLLLGSVMENFN